MTKESRGADRADLDVEVTFESEHNFYTGFTQNISGGGLFISTEVAQPIGTVVTIRFHLVTAADPIEAKAVVRWTREPGAGSGPGMGLQFLVLSDEARSAIDKFLARRDSIFFDHE